MIIYFKCVELVNNQCVAWAEFQASQVSPEPWGFYTLGASLILLFYFLGYIIGSVKQAISWL